MKPRIIFLLIFTLLSLTSCQKLEIENGTPECIEDLICDFDKAHNCENGVSVEKFTFQGKFVYVFSPGFCGADQASDVFDMECNNIGFLGGFTGNNSVNGEDFSNATFESTVWER